MLSSLKELFPGCLSLMKTKLSHFNQRINFSLNLPWSNISEIFPSPAYARVQMASVQRCGQPRCSSPKQKPRFCSRTANGENSFWTGLHFNDAGRAHQSVGQQLYNRNAWECLRSCIPKAWHWKRKILQWRPATLEADPSSYSAFAFAPLHF